MLPKGWQERLIVVSSPNTRLVRGWCLEVHDLAIAKLVAGREKDLGFVEALQRHEMVNGEILRVRLDATDVVPQLRSLVAARIRALFLRLTDFFSDI